MRPRDPGGVPEERGCTDVGEGFDSDADGTPDSVFAEEGDDLLLHTDLDADGHADQTLRLHADGSAVVDATECDGPPSPVEMLLRWLRG